MTKNEILDQPIRTMIVLLISTLIYTLIHLVSNSDYYDPELYGAG